MRIHAGVLITLCLLLAGSGVAGESARRIHRARTHARRAARADVNRDGKVGPVERKAARVVVRKRSEVDTETEERFDHNGDGTIGRGEARAMKRFEANDTNDDGKIDRHEAVDRNNDGTIGRGEAERAREIRSKRIVDTEKEEEFDADGDGKINHGEGRRMRRDAIDTDDDGKVERGELRRWRQLRREKVKEEAKATGEE